MLSDFAQRKTNPKSEMDPVMLLLASTCIGNVYLACRASLACLLLKNLVIAQLGLAQAHVTSLALYIDINKFRTQFLPNVKLH